MSLGCSSADPYLALTRHSKTTSASTQGRRVFGRWIALIVTVWVLLPHVAIGQTRGDLVGAEGVVVTRPDPAGTPTQVSVGLYFLDVAQIDDVAQEFTADVLVQALWMDLRLADPGAPPTRVLPLAEIWDPNVGFLNRRAVDPILPETVRVDPAGHVVYLQRALATFASPLDLRRFPRDEQDIGVQLVSYRYAPEELDLRVNRTTTGRLEAFSIIGWGTPAPANRNKDKATTIAL